MRPIEVTKALSFILAFLMQPVVLGLASGQAPSSDAATAAPPSTTNDPAAIFALASKLNGLDSPEIQPWHIKASYETFDDQGAPKAKGIYEQFWAGPKQYKSSFTSSGFTHTDYMTDHGLFRNGDPRWPGAAEMQVHTNLSNPLPSEGEIARAFLTMRETKFSNATLRCISLDHPVPVNPNAPPPPASPVYCFDPAKPILRFASSYGDAYRTSFGDPVIFQGRSIARDIHVTYKDKPFLNLHLETLEALQPVNESDFTPPADAVKLPPRRIAISAGVMQGNLMNKVAPVYPESAKQKRIQGAVILYATIGVDGHVQDLRVLNSPSQDLSDAAVVAARQWTYKPYLLNGEAVEVLTQMNIVFSLNP
jgi:TonB family protein